MDCKKSERCGRGDCTTDGLRLAPTAVSGVAERRVVPGRSPAGAAKTGIRRPIINLLVKKQISIIPVIRMIN